jgi:hypothetical protein
MALFVGSVVLYKVSEYASFMGFVISWVLYDVKFCKEQVYVEVFEQI